MSTLTFIGKPKATLDEQSALDYLGRILAHQGHELIATNKGDSNLAVLEGYAARGGEPTLVAKGVIDQPTDQIILYADKPLLAALDRSHPGWRDQKHILLTSDIQLFEFLDLVLSKIQETTGVTVEPF